MAKGLLHRRHRSGFRQAFHGRHLLAVSLDCEKDARAYGRSVHHHCAGTTDAVLAPDMGAGEPQPVSQKVREQQPGFDVSRYLFAVYRQVDLYAAQGVENVDGLGGGSLLAVMTVTRLELGSQGNYAPRWHTVKPRRLHRRGPCRLGCPRDRSANHPVFRCLSFNCRYDRQFPTRRRVGCRCAVFSGASRRNHCWRGPSKACAAPTYGAK